MNELIKDFLSRNMNLQENQDFATEEFLKGFRQEHPDFRLAEIIRHLNSLTIDSPHDGVRYYTFRKINNQPVPEIPEAARKIKWFKSVTADDTYSAYIPPDPRPTIDSDGVSFYLQISPRLTGWQNSLSQVPIGDLILLHQRLNPRVNNQYPRCFTHLVTPIDNEVVLMPYNNPADWPGRRVKVIAITGNQAENSIVFNQTMWTHPDAGLDGNYRDLSFRDNGRIREIPPVPRLSALQNDIWTRFQPWLQIKPEDPKYFRPVSFDLFKAEPN
jgi:hypothetical protein